MNDVEKWVVFVWVEEYLERVEVCGAWFEEAALIKLTVMEMRY